MYNVIKIANVNARHHRARSRAFSPSWQTTAADDSVAEAGPRQVLHSKRESVCVCERESWEAPATAKTKRKNEVRDLASIGAAPCSWPRQTPLLRRSGRPRVPPLLRAQRSCSSNQHRDAAAPNSSWEAKCPSLESLVRLSMAPRLCWARTNSTSFEAKRFHCTVNTLATFASGSEPTICAPSSSKKPRRMEIRWAFWCNVEQSNSSIAWLVGRLWLFGSRSFRSSRMLERDGQIPLVNLYCLGERNKK